MLNIVGQEMDVDWYFLLGSANDIPRWDHVEYVFRCNGFYNKFLKISD